MGNEKNPLLEILEMTAPGTALREGLENVLRANTGGLIVIGDPAKIKPLMNGGFNIDTAYSPAHLYELAKMDGAIIVSDDCKRIVSANVHLMPDANVPSSETGIRHRTSEQTARQTGALVICISQRLIVVQRAEMFKRIDKMLRLYLTELGDESQLLRMQADELANNVDEDELLTIRDYMIRDKKKGDFEQIDEYFKRLAKLDDEQLYDLDAVARALNLGELIENDKRIQLEPRGYRVLHKIPRLPNNVVDNLVEAFGNLQSILVATNNELDDVEAVGPARIRQIKLGLERIRAQILTDSNWVK